ncbi:MAG: histidine kinase [Chloroflexi bacterium]|nr:histidine kinase [Chloroflexota bacterium]
MHRRLNLKIGPRILIGFGITAFLALLVAVVSIAYLRGVGERLATVAERDRLLQTSALELRIAVEQESDGVRGVLLSQDKTLLEPLTSGRLQYATAETNLESLIQSSEDRKMLSEINDLHSKFLDLGQEQITLLDHGFPAAAVFLWQREGTEAKALLNRRLMEFIARQEQTISDHVRKAGEEQAQALFISLGLVAVALAAGGAGGIWLTQSITKPIRRLVLATEAIGRGDLTTRTAVPGRDELAVLGEAMNKMAVELDDSRKTAERLFQQEQRRAEQLRIINEIGRKISSILSLDELLPSVVTLLHDNYPTSTFSVFLIDHGSNDLILRAMAGRWDGPNPIGVRLKVGEEGIAGWVAKTGEMVLANDVSLEPRYRLIEQLKDTRSELALPIRVDEDIVGVLDIESSEVNGFDETDQLGARTLASQLAVAIQNAGLFRQTREMALLEERNRMAREIHDTLAQGFTGIVLQLEAAEQALDESPAEVSDHLTRAKNLARESLQEARRSVWNLLPQALEKKTLDAALLEEIERFAAAEREKVTFTLAGDRRDLPPNIQAALLRICQESLTNVQRHARATEVKVDLNFEPHTVCLTVQDNGAGCDFESVKTSGQRGGFGLTGMEQRARLLGGSLAITSQVGKGTQVEVKVPTI